jgi:hypothetical protein
MIRIIRSLALALVLTAAAGLRPADAAAQPVTICTGQPIPAGYVVVAAYRVQECPGYYASNAHNSVNIALPGDRVTVCSALSPRPEGYAVVAAYRIQECPGYYASNEHNSLTLQRPGETVTACSALTQSLPGYVITARYRIQECPGYYASNEANSATYRRIAQPVVDAPAPPAASSGEIMALDQYERGVFRRLGEMQEWLGLATPTHEVWRGTLHHAAYARGTLPVRGGARYTLVAVCDVDCTDLDLRVLDGGGSVLAQDVEPEAYASVEIVPARDGTLRVEPVMANCTASPCLYAVAVFETPAPAVEDAPAGTPLRRERIQPPGTVRPAPQQRP